MKLEDQVTSLELSERLKELGVLQESLFYWREWIKEDGLAEIKIFDGDERMNDGNGIVKLYSAFTVAELGEIIDCTFHSYKRSKQTWACFCVAAEHSEDATTEAEARAKMLIYLLENKLTPLAEGRKK